MKYSWKFEVAVLYVFDLLFGNCWEICHRCARISLAAERKMILAYYLRNADCFRGARNLVSLTSQLQFCSQFFIDISKGLIKLSVNHISNDDIVYWSKFPNFDMGVGCQKLKAMLNLRLIECRKIWLPICLSSFRNQIFCFKNSAHGRKFVVKLAARKGHC